MWFPSGVATNCDRLPALLLVSNLYVFVARLNSIGLVEPPMNALPVLVVATLIGSEVRLGGVAEGLCDGSSGLKTVTEFALASTITSCVPSGVMAIAAYPTPPEPPGSRVFVHFKLT